MLQSHSRWVKWRGAIVGFRLAGGLPVLLPSQEEATNGCSDADYADEGTLGDGPTQDHLDKVDPRTRCLSDVHVHSGFCSSHAETMGWNRPQKATVAAVNRTRRNSTSRRRSFQRSMTLPVASSGAANRVMVPWRTQSLFAFSDRPASVSSSRAVERLDLELLVHAEHDRVPWRRRVEPGEGGDLPDELGIGGEVERLAARLLDEVLAPALGQGRVPDAQINCEEPSRLVGDA